MSANYIPNFSAVVISFIVIMLIWPRMVFWKYLRGKKISYQLAFCVCGMFVLTNFACLFLGSIGALNQIFYNVLFWGAFAFMLGWRVWDFYKEYQLMEEGEVIEIPFITKFVGWWDGYKDRLLRRDKSGENPWIDIILNVLLIAIIAALVFHMGEDIRIRGQYIFSDTERHEGMVTQMIQNDLFKDGVYPYGMHCIFYTAVTSAAANLYNFNMYSGNIMTLIFFIALYFWCRRVLKTKMAAITVLALFLIVATSVLHFSANDRMIYDGLHRLRYTLPEEYCLFACFIAPACLIKIMKSKESMKTPENFAYLLLLALSIGTVLATHYYTLMFQFVICVATFFSYILLCKKEKFVALAISVGSAAVAVLIPFGLGWVKCKKLSAALNWASDLPQGKSNVFERLASVVPENSAAAKAGGMSTAPATQVTKGSDPIGETLRSLWNDAIVPLFTQDFAILFSILIGIGLVIFVIACFKKRHLVPGYLSVIICALVFFAMYAAPCLQITRLLESYRVVIVLYVMILVMWVFVIDFFLDFGTTAIENAKTGKSKSKKKKAAKKPAGKKASAKKAGAKSSSTKKSSTKGTSTKKSTKKAPAKKATSTKKKTTSAKAKKK